jgi:glutathione S-transferase
VRLYDFLPSGNSYKVRLLLNQLGIPYERVPVDILKRETYTPEFLARNPNGRIPLLELDEGCFLAESNAILWYLARNTSFLPTDHFQQALALQWMFFEQYSHEPYIATSRYWISILGKKREYEQALVEKKEPGYHALGVMESHLEKSEYFVGGRYTIADISLYAYTHVAHEGEFDLSRHPAIQAWLRRVEGQSGYIPITKET